MKTKRKPGTRPANSENPITLTLGFAASEADRELVSADRRALDFRGDPRGDPQRA
jgi:hypothetical protein